MAEFTDNHQIEKPEEGKAPWTQAYHDLVDHVEQASEVRAPNNQRSNYEPKANTIFRATDTGALYIGTGSNWIKVDLRVAELHAENAHLSNGKISSDPTQPNDIVNKDYADDIGEGAGMDEHGNEWHDPPMATEQQVNDIDADTINALPTSGGELSGVLVINSSTHRDHLNLQRSSIGNWHITPTSSEGGGLELSDTETGTNAYVSSNGHFIVNSLRTMMTDTTNRFDVQDYFPADPTTRDVCLRTDENALYYYDGSDWVGAGSGGTDDGGDTGGGGDGGSTTNYYVDDFNRSSPGSEWQTVEGYNPIEFRDSSGITSDRGMFVPASAQSESTSGLDNYPEAGGGPNNDGAFEFAFRQESSGGTLDLSRIDFAVGGGDFYRFQLESNKLGFRQGTTEILTMKPQIGVGDERIVRMNEWTTGGDIDVGVYDTSGTELVRQSYTDSRSGRPQSGGIRVRANGSTSFSIDQFRLLE